MSKPAPESIQIGVWNGMGWQPIDPIPLTLDPGFTVFLPDLVRDLVRKQIVEDLRLAREDLEATNRRQRETVAHMARLEQALAEMDGEP